ncbi:hypothetical protein [Niabella drilacis]|uniref:Uncharacterized protein n=1 Tax=Niabella drilacis (strain DSM 25811 / CCM 8410 / CCUG 62505 / LMG 26954 / E90) TaxID=1285928 RepID=A0A1G6XFI3_NIADE|nr:hypothetical protein [Niabella drilacis]SDD76969.1 hypothetical protein SAMN04487894_11360 [Niabella drilacis]
MEQRKNTRITNEQFRQRLFDLLNAGDKAAHKKTNFWRLLKTDFRIDKSRSLNLHDQFYKEWASLQQSAIEKTTIAVASEKTYDALISRDGKIDWYASEIRKMEAQLRGDQAFTFIIHTKTFNSHSPEGKFQVPIQIQNELRRMLKDYISELSKLSGEYVTKIAESNPDGEEKFKFDPDAIPIDVLLELMKHLKPQNS